MTESLHSAQIREDLSETITETLLRVVNRLQAGRRHSRDYGAGDVLTVIEAQTCYLIRRQTGISAREVSETLAVTPSAVSQILGRLKQNGHIFEKTDPAKATRKQLYLTEQGAKAMVAASHLGSMMKSMLCNEELEELEVYRRFVTKLEDFCMALRR